MSKINILGVQVEQIRLADILTTIQQAVLTRQRVLITHVNVTGLCIAYEQEWYRQFLNQTDLVYCDGMGVQLGARLLGHRLPERFTLADWIWPLAEMAAREGLSMYLLGNPPGVAEQASARLRQRYPELIIAGARHGFFEKTAGRAENEAVLQQINTAHPDILLVGFGMPTQERWLKDNWAHLDVRVAITCGALFEYISGDLPRGPAWMTQHYLEWLARMLISPRRYAARYLRDNPLFFYRVLKQRLSAAPE